MTRFFPSLSRKETDAGKRTKVKVPSGQPATANQSVDPW